MSNNVAHTCASHGSTRSYMTGFILSIILTLIPFLMVMQGSVAHTLMLAVIIVTAVIQILVHLVYFLHMNTSSEQSWNLLAFIFTVVVVAIVIVGSVWIMIHLNSNMVM